MSHLVRCPDCRERVHPGQLIDGVCPICCDDRALADAIARGMAVERAGGMSWLTLLSADRCPVCHCEVPVIDIAGPPVRCARCVRP